MPNIAQNDIVQVRIEYEAFGQKDLNVFHYRVSQVNGAVEMFSFLGADLLAGFDAAGNLFDDLLEKMSPDIKMTYAYAQVIRPTRYRFVRRTIDRPGADIGSMPTNNIALSLGFSPELAGRGKSGRMQIPGLPQKYMLAGKWDNIVKDHYTGVGLTYRVNTWTVGATGVTLEPILFRPQNGTWNKIATASAFDTIRVMRRRTVGLGI